MKQPPHWPIRKALDDAAAAVRSLEADLIGWHLTDACAIEARDVATRLLNLTLPDKGHLDGATPGVEIDTTTSTKEI